MQMVSQVSGTPLIMALDSTKHGVSESDTLNCVKLLVKVWYPVCFVSSCLLLDGNSSI